MSGGSFDYLYEKVEDMANEIYSIKTKEDEFIIKYNNSKFIRDDGK